MSVEAASATSPRRRIAVDPLAETQIDQAFPLVHPLLPRIGVAAWRDFARSVLRGTVSHRGILVAKETDACLLGLVVYEVADDLRHGRVARVDPLAAADLVDPAIVARALLRAVEIAAVRCGCEALAIPLVAHRPEMRRWLAAAGYADRAEYLYKPVPRLVSTEAVEKEPNERS